MVTLTEPTTNHRAATSAPSSPEAEEAVLGSILINPDSLLEVISFLQPRDFFNIRNGWLFEAMLKLHNHSEGIDELTLTREMRTRGQLDTIGGPAYITGLTNNTPTFTHIETYARLVERAAIRRRLLEATGEIAKVAYQEQATIPEILDKAETIFRAATTRSIDRFVLRGDMLVDEAYSEWLEWANNPADIRGLSSGIDGLDRILGGLTPGVYAIGGATSMGKSTLVAFITRMMASQGPGLLIPTETPGKTMLHKMAGDMAGIPFKDLRSGRYSSEVAGRISQAYDELRKVAHNMRIMDSSHPTLSAIHAEILRMPNCQWVVIDSGSKLSSAVKSGDMRLLDAVNQVSAFSQDLARMGLPVIVTWQFGRNAKDRGIKVPQLNDFKESGSIEEDADVCLGIYRHDYYLKRGMVEPRDDDRIKFPPGTAKLLLLKDRAGADGDEAITLHFKAGRGFFENVNVED